MNNFCSIFSKKLLKNCLVFFVVPAILLVACGAPNDADADADAKAKAKSAASKLPAESAPKSWDKAFEHMLTALHAPYTDGDCFFKTGIFKVGTADGTPSVMKIMGKNLVVDSPGTFKVPSKGTGSFSITTLNVVASLKAAVAFSAAAAAGANKSGVVIHYDKFQPAGSNVMIDGKIGLNGKNAAIGLAMFHAAAAADAVAEPVNGGKLIITGPGYKAELSFDKPTGALADASGNSSPNNYTVAGTGKACDAGAASVVGVNGEPFGGTTHALSATSGAFSQPTSVIVTSQRIIVKFNFNKKDTILVGLDADAKGQDLMKKFVSVKKTAPAAT